MICQKRRLRAAPTKRSVFGRARRGRRLRPAPVVSGVANVIVEKERQGLQEIPVVSAARTEATCVRHSMGDMVRTGGIGRLRKRDHSPSVQGPTESTRGWPCHCIHGPNTQGGQTEVGRLLSGKRGHPCRARKKKPPQVGQVPAGAPSLGTRPNTCIIAWPTRFASAVAPLGRKFFSAGGRP